jgi:hypothetical protein
VLAALLRTITPRIYASLLIETKFSLENQLQQRTAEAEGKAHSSLLGVCLTAVAWACVTAVILCLLLRPASSTRAQQGTILTIATVLIRRY